MTTTIIVALVGTLVGLIAGYYVRYVISLSKKKSLELDVKQIRLQAKEEAQSIIEKAEQKSEDILKEVKEKEEKKENEFKQTAERLFKREEQIDKRQQHIDAEIEKIKQKTEELQVIKEKLSEKDAEKTAELERISNLTADDAKAELIADIESRSENDLVARIQKMENVTKEKLDDRAREILVTTIQRYANSTVNDLTTTAVSIPSDDAKGKIIGKEGRNIRSFERAAGVELIVDDTPDTVIVSSFDPIRRQIARVALENLILDGRIQPAKIEEAVEKARNEINTIIKEKGEQAAYDVGILNLDPRIVAILGRLYFRTSYGQNVLQHSVEMAHIAGMLAEQLGADPYIARAGALVHDIGKALDHEIQGTHVQIGMRILRKFGADERIVTAMKAHHEEYPYESLEAVIVQTADAISGARPGARRDTSENYIKRLQELEGVATSFDGVEKAFALSAGREVRVFVYPDKVSDLEAEKMARNIADQVEQDLKYPGEIKVTLIRENRLVEYAR
jgi:ribonuclease Y